MVRPEDLTEMSSEQMLDWAISILESGDFQERWDVAKILPKLGREAIAPLINILQDEDAEEELRWFAARVLAEFKDPAVITALVELLKTSESEELTGMAAEALASIGAQAVAALTDLLENEETRLLAVRSLSYIRRSEVITPLLTVVRDGEVAVRVAAIEALSSFHDERVPPVLLEALKDLSAPVRREAVMGLGLRSDLQKELDLVKVLKPLLWDFKLEVCIAAANALARLGTDSAADALFELLEAKATPVELQIEAIRALGWVGNSKALSHLEQVLMRSELAICQEIALILGRIEPPLAAKAVQIAIDFLKSNRTAASHPTVKQNLAMSLGQLGEISTLDTLIQMLADSDLGVRLHAIAALKKFPTALDRLQQMGAGGNLTPELKQGVAIALQEWHDRS